MPARSIGLKIVDPSLAVLYNVHIFIGLSGDRLRKTRESLLLSLVRNCEKTVKEDTTEDGDRDRGKCNGRMKAPGPTNVVIDILVVGNTEATMGIKKDALRVLADSPRVGIWRLVYVSSPRTLSIRPPAKSHKAYNPHINFGVKSMIQYLDYIAI